MTDPSPMPPEAGVESPKRRAPRWMTVLLVVSLGLNLLVVGLVAGAMVDQRRGGDRAAFSIDGPNPFLRAFTDADAREIRRLLRPQAGDLMRGRAELGQAMRDALTELRADSLSEAELRRAFDDIKAINARRAAVAQDTVLAYLLTLDPEARRAFADRLEAGLQRRGGPRGAPPSKP